jgi:fatty-acyl-CoA synthase
VDSDQLTMAMVAARARREFGDRAVVSRIDGQVVTHTYREFFARVDRLAWALRALGVQPGDRVGTLAWNHHRHLELYLAVTLSGAVLHTINLRLAADQVLAIARHAGDRAMFVDADLADLLSTVHSELSDLAAVVRLAGPTDGPATPGILDYEELLAAQPSEPFRYPELDERSAAATSYSSATTGRPKGVVYSHRALVLHSLMLGLSDTWAISEADTVLPVVPMFHVNAWGLPFTALWMGSRLVLPGRRPTAADLLPLLSDQRVTVTAAVPTVWMDVLRELRSTGRALPDLRLVVSGGAPLPEALLREADELGVPLVHSYGMTEASPVVLVGRVRSDVADSPERDQLRLRQGLVVPGLDYRVVDEQGNEVPRDGRSPGELRLRGPWVAEEYERDERSRATFVDGWYRTGDIVTVEPHGYVQVVDRLADLIKSGGEWISSVELENALMSHPVVSAAAVVAVPDDRWQERPKAFVVPQGEVTVEELREFLAQRFPRFWVPEQFAMVDAIPLTSVGKFDKKTLRAAHGSPPAA